MGKAELSKGEHRSSGPPVKLLSSRGGFPAPQARSLGHPRSLSGQWLQLSRAGSGSGWDSQHSPPCPARPAPGTGNSRDPFPSAHLLSLRTRGATGVTLKGTKGAVSPARVPWSASPGWGGHLTPPMAMPTVGTPPWHGGPHRLPWKADPWRSWLPWGSRFTGQPLRSHEAGVTLEDNGGGWQCWQCHQVPHLPPLTPKAPGTFWPLGPTTQISPGRPWQEGIGM